MITKNVGVAMGLLLVLLMGLVPVSVQAVSGAAAPQGEAVKTPFGNLYFGTPGEAADGAEKRRRHHPDQRARPLRR